MRRLSAQFVIPFFFLLMISHGIQGQEKMQSFKLALVQMTVIGGDRQTNLKHAGEHIAAAAQHGANVILLPEAMDLGWTHPSALTEAQPIPTGETCTFLQKLAVENQLYIVSGLIEKADDTVYNSAVLIDPTGALLLTHRKINELDIGHPYYAVGDRLHVAKTKFGTFGLMICADANTSEFHLTRSLCYMGADVILSPCSWAVVANHDNDKEPYGALWKNAYKAVAQDFSVWIAGCSNVGWMTDGPWKGWKGIGCSLVIAPDGEEALSGPYGAEADTVLYVDVTPVKRPAQGTDWPSVWKK